VLSPEDAELLRRWDALLAGLRDRLSAEELAEIDEEAAHDASLGIATLLGGHEKGLHELTPGEEAELWDLAAEWECRDQDVMNDDVRAASVRNRPVPMVRPKHPLRGGGHGARSGKPGKHAFPGRWSDDEAVAHAMDVARAPSDAVQLPTGEFVAHGERDGVLLGVVVSPAGEVLTGYPVHGPGVKQQPMDEHRGPAAQRLRDLLQAVLPKDHELRALLDELQEVGEWPYVVATLRTLDLALTDEQRTELAQLAYLADLSESTP
jgi:hypothetical protein